jgi:hypothetical protein
VNEGKICKKKVLNLKVKKNTQEGDRLKWEEQVRKDITQKEGRMGEI